MVAVFLSVRDVHWCSQNGLGDNKKHIHTNTGDCIYHQEFGFKPLKIGNHEKMD